MSTRNLLVLSVLFGLIGAALYFYLFPDYSAMASVDLKLSRAEVIAVVKDKLNHIGYRVDDLDAEANFKFGSSRTLLLQTKQGIKHAHDMIRADSLDIHEWHVYLYDRSLPPSQMPNQYDAWLSPSGRLIGFRHQMPDSIVVVSLREEDARALAESFLTDQGIQTSDYILDRSKTEQFPGRKDHTFFWTRKDTSLNIEKKVWVRVQGNRVGGFRAEWELPELFTQTGSKIQTVVQFIITASAISTFLLLLFIIPLFLKKYLEGEVGIKTALIVFVPLFLIIITEHTLGWYSIGYNIQMGDMNRADVRLVVYVLAVFILNAFLAMMVLAAWSVGESSARRGWSNKLAAIDGILHGKFFTLDLARSVVNGYSLGFTILGALFGLYAIRNFLSNFGSFVVSLHSIPESFYPSLSAILLALRIAILTEIVFRLFFITWLREKTDKNWPGILVSSAIWTLAAFTLWDFPLAYINFTWLFPAYFLAGAVLGLILVRYDLLTAITANFVVLAFTYATPIMMSSSPFFQQQKLIFLILMGVPLLIAGIGFVRRQKFEFSYELIPAHIRRISERERMAKELEIARTVQMSLLPRGNPEVEGYDIAGICVPALEVGGDYYDFFNLGSEKFGVAIGDVSGKGVPAAIYMTLTKGILQSHASESFSPKEVLNKLNRQMYNNIERNSFVSMFYAVIDMKDHVIHFSRAGHNPAILAHRATNIHQLLEPKGIALGLQDDKKFSQYLEESTIRLHSGDVLTFYTDGFTEASNGSGEEFGEEKLLEIVSSSKNAAATEIIQNIVKSVKSFVGNSPQRDDMTMVVVKAL